MNTHEADKDKSHYVRVDGIGQWNLWRRNFRSPLLAVLDLMDNSLDATLGGGNGKIYFLPDHNQNDEITGFKLINSCARSPKSIDQVFAIGSSGKAAEQIGENGVGLKQACATLSNLSFVLILNREELTLGILARDLQKHEGLYMPRFVFKCHDLMAEEIADKLGEDTEIAACVAQYGHGSFVRGVDKLMNQYDSIRDTDGDWHSFHSVFCLLIHEPVATLVGPIVKGEQTSSNATEFLRAIHEELPSHYLHISDDIDIRVNGLRVRFDYWQARLVELTQCVVKVDPDELFSSSANLTMDGASGYNLRVFMGFDPLKASSNNKSLYVYSRKTGRRIKDGDAKSILRLGTGGTEYAQGLTVIVDDYNSMLPLDPTKQGVAFGEEENGTAHETNLFAWVGAAVYSYWNYHFAKYKDKYANPKGVLTDVVTSFAESLSSQDKTFRPLDKARLTKMIVTSWTKRAAKAGRFNIRLKKPTVMQPGEETFWRIPSNVPGVVPKNAQRPPRALKPAPQSTPKRRKPSPSATVSPSTGTPSSQRPPYTRSGSFEVDSSDDELSLHCNVDSLVRENRDLRWKNSELRRKMQEMERTRIDNDKSHEKPRAAMKDNAELRRKVRFLKEQLEEKTADLDFHTTESERLRSFLKAKDEKIETLLERLASETYIEETHL